MPFRRFSSVFFILAKTGVIMSMQKEKSAVGIHNLRNVTVRTASQIQILGDKK